MIRKAVRLGAAMLPEFARRHIKAVLGWPQTRLHDDWNVLRSIGPVYRPHVVLDVGAHHGWFFHCWQDWCPQAEVYAFEPTEASFDTMTRLYGTDPRVHLNMIGVGAAKGELTLRMLEESPVSNSFLVPDADAWDSIQYRAGAVHERRVPVTSLDEYCRERGIESVYLLKIDVQGFEVEVLRGANRMLRDVQYVFVESGIRRLYEGAPTFAETFLELERRGFDLMHLRAWHRGNRVLIETDMLFRRNDLAPPIDRARDRYYLELG